ncbi:secretoglobin family 1D member 1-like [Suricata suricatta]|uniref:secretoglobin family 1D member 1-like n=1 Tax=Suricata suricatta TaxID=37032 RepID=UPI0011569554|nr:secretoglobin family 1D member 1-like [Suricata suricatta]
MRLFLSVLLVTLALCCYEANAIVCPDIAKDFEGFLWEDKTAFELSLQKYRAPPENVQAVLDVKTCIDNISAEGRSQLVAILGHGGHRVEDETRGELR